MSGAAWVSYFYSSLVGHPEPQGSSFGSFLGHFLNIKLQQALSKYRVPFLNMLALFSQMSKFHAVHRHQLVNPLTFLVSFFLKDSSQTFGLYSVHWWYLRIVSIHWACSGIVLPFFQCIFTNSIKTPLPFLSHLSW